MATKKEKELTLEQVLWNCRVDLRGYGSFEKNRDAVIGLAFLKFASDKFEKRRKEIIEEHGNVPAFLEKVSFYNSKNVYYLDEHCRWSYFVKEAGSNDIAVKLDKAMKDIEDKNPPLKGALPQNIYASLGVSKEKMKSLIDDVNMINEERFHEEDLIGRVYEYFLQNYAASASKDDGEFYTPACVVQLIAELIEPYDGIVYDPCCGSGGMFVQSMKFVDSHKGNRNKVTVMGQESNPDTWRLAKMNLSIRGIACDLGDKNASTFTDDQHKDKTVQYIMANPPFNLKNWRGEDELLDDPRFKPYKPAMPPKANANYAWILHMLSKLDVNRGIAGFLLANGALNAGSGSDDEDDEGGQAQYLIRKKILEGDKVEAIIALPRDMFYTTDIAVTLWILNNNKKAGSLNGRNLRDRTGEVLFIDLRQWNENIEEYTIDKGKKKKKTVFNESQIEKVKEIYNNWQSVECTNSDNYNEPELYRSVKLSEIKKKNYTLIPSKYIEFIDQDLNINFDEEMSRIQKEMINIMKSEKESQKLLEESFKEIGYEIK
ncbi:MAG TPA: N-6 DNA methylase [Candidatus Onthousia excrementipullorum]|uniref:site-specific DNA-methyltransferase (adenine-specific) n=1 Tax=Candidatus Onthousia excrementipullorum TaxID=2840884 RepID=A0A9D1DUH9_9FIRM|nr:N-6 DNA methylase [Candidatus Onthousia excrementipullorum]